MRFASFYTNFDKTMISRSSFQHIFVFWIFFATVRGAKITRVRVHACLGPYNDSYTCPGLSDPPEKTHCCLWDGQPACCLPGGSSCSDNHADKRNYCPGPNYGKERAQCCIWNSQPACCPPGGSPCSDSADIRNYCPGPDEGNDRTYCCVWDSRPTCCLPGGSSCSDNANIRNYCPGPKYGKNDRFCTERNGKVFCSHDPFWIIHGIVMGFVSAVVTGCIFAILCRYFLCPKL